MLWAVFRLDRRQGAQEIRASTRPAHLEYMKSLGDRVKAGGPLLGDDGETAVGGLMVVEASNRGEVEAILEHDPYEKAGLSEIVEIRAWRWTRGRPENLP
jgi:uncharacterized protein YciI